MSKLNQKVSKYRQYSALLILPFDLYGLTCVYVLQPHERLPLPDLTVKMTKMRISLSSNSCVERPVQDQIDWKFLPLSAFLRKVNWDLQQDAQRYRKQNDFRKFSGSVFLKLLVVSGLPPHLQFCRPMLSGFLIYLGKNKNAQGTIENISQAWRIDRRGVRGRRRRTPKQRPTSCGGPLCHTGEVLHRRGVGLRWLRDGASGHQLEDLRTSGRQNHQQKKWVGPVGNYVYRMYEWAEAYYLPGLQILIPKKTKTCATKRW